MDNKVSIQISISLKKKKASRACRSFIINAMFGCVMLVNLHPPVSHLRVNDLFFLSVKKSQMKKKKRV